MTVKSETGEDGLRYLKGYERLVREDEERLKALEYTKKLSDPGAKARGRLAALKNWGKT